MISPDKSMQKGVSPSPERDYELDVKDFDETARKRESLISMFGYLSLSKDELSKARYMREKDLVSYLNSQISSFSSESQHSDAKYFTFKDATFISAIRSSSSKNIGG